jgi:hypothetical protein
MIRSWIALRRCGAGRRLTVEGLSTRSPNRRHQPRIGKRADGLLAGKMNCRERQMAALLVACIPISRRNHFDLKQKIRSTKALQPKELDLEVRLSIAVHIALHDRDLLLHILIPADRIG